MLIRTTLILALAISTLLAAFQPGTALAADRPDIIRIGIPAQPGADGKLVAGMPAELVVPYLQKELANDGTKFEIKLVTGSGPGINEAFANSALDFAYTGDFPGITGRAGGLPIKIVVSGEHGHNSYLVVPLGSTAKSIKDLVGKRVAINKGRPWELAMSRLLVENGLKESDVNLFNLAQSDADAAIAAKSVDGFYTVWGAATEARGTGTIIWSTRSKPLAWKYTADIFATEDFIAKYPETTQKVVRAYVQSALYQSKSENREETLHTMVTKAFTYPVVLQEYDGVAMKDIVVPLIDPFLRAHYEQSIAFAVENKLIRKPITAQEMFDSRFVEAAIKELNLADYWTSSDADGNPLSMKKAEK